MHFISICIMYKLDKSHLLFAFLRICENSSTAFFSLVWNLYVTKLTVLWKTVIKNYFYSISPQCKVNLSDPRPFPNATYVWFLDKVIIVIKIMFLWTIKLCFRNDVGVIIVLIIIFMSTGCLHAMEGQNIRNNEYRHACLVTECEQTCAILSSSLIHRHSSKRTQFKSELICFKVNHRGFTTRHRFNQSYVRE